MNGNDAHREAICDTCGAQFTFQARILNGKEVLPDRECDSCDAKRSAHDPDAERRVIAERKAAFRANIPKLFRDTDKSRLPSLLTTAIESWSYGPKGLAFAGPSGKAKTRAMFILLEYMAGLGRSVDFITSTDFDDISREQFSDDAMERNAAKEKLRSIRTVKILLLDDLGKSKMTERVETELFALFDTRTSAGLPTLWTSNLSAKELLSMVAPHNRDAFERRIGKDFTTIISLKGKV